MISTVCRWTSFVLLLGFAGPLSADSELEVKGRLEVRDGQRFLFVWGYPEERGFAEGYLLAEEIIDSFTGFVLSPTILPNPAVWDQQIMPLINLGVEPRPESFQRAKGLINGMEARLAKGRRQKGRSKMFVEVLGRKLKPQDFIATLALPDWIGLLCSSFVAAEDLLADGAGPLVGRNLDYMGTDALLDAFLVRVEAPSEGRHGWVGLGYCGALGCLTGVSSAQVSVAIHDVPIPTPNKGGKVTPRIDALQELIEKLTPGEDTGSDAGEILRRYRYGYGGNVMVGWHSEQGDSGGVVCEIDDKIKKDRGVSVRVYEADVPFIVCTNHHRLRRRSSAQSCDRYAALTDGCELVAAMEADLLDFDAAWELIQQASKADTLYRNVIDLEEGSVRVQNRVGRKFVKPFEFNFLDLIHECVSFSRPQKARSKR